VWFITGATRRLRSHAHPGVECTCTLQGTLSVHIGDEEHALQPGDSMYLDATVFAQLQAQPGTDLQRHRGHGVVDVP
jgi:anti-sigma factor ChrR (cupin superfamily)